MSDLVRHRSCYAGAEHLIGVVYLRSRHANAIEAWKVETRLRAIETLYANFTLGCAPNAANAVA